MTVATLEDILNILNTRRQHCRDLLELSRHQNQVIRANDYSQLMSILAQKQRILGRLDEISAHHPELPREWKALRETGIPALRSDCESVIAETEAILAELLKTEKEGATYLTERRDATRRQIRGISDGARLHELYRDNLAPVSHRHLDVGR